MNDIERRISNNAAYGGELPLSMDPNKRKTKMYNRSAIQQGTFNEKNEAAAIDLAGIKAEVEAKNQRDMLVNAEEVGAARGRNEVMQDLNSYKKEQDAISSFFSLDPLEPATNRVREASARDAVERNLLTRTQEDMARVEQNNRAVELSRQQAAQDRAQASPEYQTWLANNPPQQ